MAQCIAQMMSLQTFLLCDSSVSISLFTTKCCNKKILIPLKLYTRRHYDNNMPDLVLPLDGLVEVSFF